MKKYIKKNWKNILVCIIYMTITFILMLFHENWRDEAQAWLIARDCTIPELISQMKYEGHFMLWYLILMPFAKLGFPYITMNVISWIISSISVYLILTKAPFKWYKRVLLVFTFPLLYLYPVISRCYCLIPLAICLMALSYNKRIENPLRFLLSVIVLANTHIIMLGMVGVVVLDYIIEVCKKWKNLAKKNRQKIVVSFSIFFVLLVLSGLPLLSCLSSNKEVGSKESIIDKLINTFLTYPLAIIGNLGCEPFNITVMGIYLCIALLTIFIYFLLDFKNNKKVYIEIMLCILFQSAIYSFIYGMSQQKCATIIFIFLYFKWISYNTENIENKMKNNIKDICSTILLLACIISGCMNITYDINFNYSNAFQIAEYINNNIEEGSIIVSGSRTEFASSVIPYISKDIKFYQASTGKYFTYTVFDDNNKQELDYDKLIDLKNTFKEEKLYFIYFPYKYRYISPLTEHKEEKLVEECTENNILKKLYSTDELALDEKVYVLYEIELNKLFNS